MTENNKKKQKKHQHPLEGISAAAVLLLWGLLFLYAPSYFEIASNWRWLLIGIGVIPLFLSFILAMVALGNLWKSEALQDLASSMIFIIPAAVIHLTVTRVTLSSAWVTAGKVLVLIFVFLGGLLFFNGLPKLFLKSGQDQSTESSPEELAGKKLARREADVKTIMSVIVALLSLAVGIVKIFLEFGK